MFKLCTFNVNHSRLLSGIVDFLISENPDIVAIQEVPQGTEELNALISRYGYGGFSSLGVNEQPGVGYIYRTSLQVREIHPLVPGRMLLLTLDGGLQFINVYAPSGNQYREQRRMFFGETLLRNLSHRDNLPILLGDFNCILHRSDTTANFEAKNCPALTDLIRLFNYTDVHQLLKPHTLGDWTFSRPGGVASRLDRVYIPLSLVGDVSSIEHLPTLSDHRLVIVEITGNVPVPPIRAAAHQPYWKLNSKILQDEDFVGNFELFWNHALINQPSYPSVCDWWEIYFKPNLKQFLIKYSKVRAYSRKGTKDALFELLDLALKEGDWEEVVYIRSRIRSMIQEDLEGFLVRSRNSEHAEVEAGSLYHVAREVNRGKVANLSSLMVDKAGTMVETDDWDSIEESILSFYGPLFNGHHRTHGGMVDYMQKEDEYFERIHADPDGLYYPPDPVEASEPVDTGSPFVPDLSELDLFLEGIPTLSEDERRALELPFSLEELEDALKTCASNKSPGLDGITYELYKKVKRVIAPTMLEVLNTAVNSGLLPESMRKGVTRLLSKVPGTPSVSQLRPITLLSTDYKILTKMLTGRLSRVLPDLLQSGQLCGTKPKNILFGASNILSSIDYVNVNHLDAYIISFDIFKAYDKTTIEFVTRVMRKMGFGPEFISWVETCHREITTCFILGKLTRELPVAISLRQGDPAAMPLFLINMEPLLNFIKHNIQGIQIGPVKQGSEPYVDDVTAVSSRLEDMRLLNKAFLRFESLSGTVLNRTSKTKVMGLGGWAGRERWPLTWVRTAPSLRILGINFHPTVAETIRSSWESCSQGYFNLLVSWGSRNLPTLEQRVRVLTTFAMSKLWYLAQVLPIPGTVVEALERTTRVFLWRGRMEKLPYEELFNKVEEGGLGLPSISVRCDSLFLTQVSRILSVNGPHRNHLIYWIGMSLTTWLPELRGGLNAQITTPYFKKVICLLKESFILGAVNPQGLKQVKAKKVYLELMNSPPPPKVLSKHAGVEWERVWRNLRSKVISIQGRDLIFSIIHNIYKTKSRLFRMNQHPSGLCNWCRVEETCSHFFTSCIYTNETWIYLKTVLRRIIGSQPLIMDNLRLLFLDIQPHRNLNEILFLISFYVIYVHSCKWEGNNPTVSHLKGFLKHAILVYSKGNFPSLGNLIENL